jgi:hypothetical protein
LFHVDELGNTRRYRSIVKVLSDELIGVSIKYEGFIILLLVIRTFSKQDIVDRFGKGGIGGGMDVVKGAMLAFDISFLKGVGVDVDGVG